MIIIHHNKDMDGYTSGAICKKKYPQAKLIGWDYRDEVPNVSHFKGEDVIMIDISFPVEKLLQLSHIADSLVLIDHHISFKKQMDEVRLSSFKNFQYVYEDGKAACEIGWKFLFPDKPIPYGVTLIGRYDTWRQQEGDWEGETLPFKFYMYGHVKSAEEFENWVLDSEMDKYISEAVGTGMAIMRYQHTMDESIAEKNAFEREAYGLRALCLDYYPFSSETLKSVFNSAKHDVMVGFTYTGNKWGISLRSIGDVDVSVIAKERGGGGHKNAAGFEVKEFENIFK